MKFSHLLLLLICSLNDVQGAPHGGLFSHLKPAGVKSDSHKIDNVDFIYMINLDGRPDKYQDSLERLAPYNIVPFRFSGVNGWQLSRDALSEIGVRFQETMSSGFWATHYPPDPAEPFFHEVLGVPDRIYFCHCMSQGAIGCALSHISVLKDAYDSGYQTIWVMEDDIEVVQNPHLISRMITKLDKTVGKNGWDILFTDRDTRNNKGHYVPAAGMARRPNYIPKDLSRLYLKEPVGKDFIRTGARFGAYSMIVRRSGMQKLLNFFKRYQLFFPFDMEYHLPEGMRLFTVQNDIIRSRLDAPSNNGTPLLSLDQHHIPFEQNRDIIPQQP